jgi:hypothetical protein
MWSDSGRARCHARTWAQQGMNGREGDRVSAMLPYFLPGPARDAAGKGRGGGGRATSTVIDGALFSNHTRAAAQSPQNPTLVACHGGDSLSRE